MRGSSSRSLPRRSMRGSTSEDDEVDTLGGLVFLLAGRILGQGESRAPSVGLAARSASTPIRGKILRVRLHAPEPGQREPQPHEVMTRIRRIRRSRSSLGAASAFAFEPVGWWPLMLARLRRPVRAGRARAGSLRRALLIGWVLRPRPVRRSASTGSRPPSLTRRRCRPGSAGSRSCCCRSTSPSIRRWLPGWLALRRRQPARAGACAGRRLGDHRMAPRDACSPALPGTRSAVDAGRHAAAAAQRAGSAPTACRCWSCLLGGAACGSSATASMVAAASASSASPPCCWALRRAIAAPTPSDRQADPHRPAQHRPAGQMAPGLRRGRRPAPRPAVRSSGPPVTRLLFWPEAAVTEPLEDARAGAAARSPSSSGCARRALLGPGDVLLTGGLALTSSDGTTRRWRHQQHLRARAARAHRRPLRQGASRSLRRISADAAAAVGDRPVAAGAGRHRFRRRARAADDRAARHWGKVGFQLCYEIIFSGEVVDRAQPPRLHLQPVERRLVRPLGPAAASRPGAAARRRGRPAGDPLDADRDQRGDRRARPRCFSRCLAHGRRDRRRAAAARCAPTLFARLGNIIPLPLGFLLLDRGDCARAAALATGATYKDFLISRFSADFSQGSTASHAQQLSLHLRIGFRRPSRQGRRPDQRRDRRPVPVEGPEARVACETLVTTQRDRPRRRNPLPGGL